MRWAAGLPLAGTTIELSELALYTWSEERRVRQFVIRERAPLGG